MANINLKKYDLASKGLMGLQKLSNLLCAFPPKNGALVCHSFKFFCLFVFFSVLFFLDLELVLPTKTTKG
jgi:hypothetical protein